MELWETPCTQVCTDTAGPIHIDYYKTVQINFVETLRPFSLRLFLTLFRMVSSWKTHRALAQNDHLMPELPNTAGGGA